MNQIINSIIIGILLGGASLVYPPYSTAITISIMAYLLVFVIYKIDVILDSKNMSGIDEKLSQLAANQKTLLSFINALRARVNTFHSKNSKHTNDDSDL